MTKNEQKIEQCKKDIKTLQANLAELEGETELVQGDIAVNAEGTLRLIVGSSGDMVSVDIFGRAQSSQVNFKYWGYKKVGVISDYISETILNIPKEN